MMRDVLLAAGLVLWSGSTQSLAQTPPAGDAAGVTATSATLVGDEAGGEATYTAVCRTCHGGMVAPTLRGVPGREIGAVADFSGYSSALKARASEVWTDANLDAFIKAPAEFAPGTLMTASLPDDKARADVIAFIKTLPPPR